MADEQAVTDTQTPDVPASESAGTSPSETADGFIWSAAVPIEGGVRVSGTDSAGNEATTDAKDQAAARRAIRAYFKKDVTSNG